MEADLGSTERKGGIWSTGLAMFAMFFGAGNIVFPLALGKHAQDKSFFGVAGLIITAVLVPLTGVFALLLYNGDYMAFFRRIGKIPGFVVTVMILCLIGPFGGIPRCITISFSTLNAFGFSGIAGINLISFSFVSCVVIFLFSFRQNKILTLLGGILTPILLITLGTIIFKGLMQMPTASSSTFTSWQAFSRGILEGYNTMDLLSSFFFSSIVLVCLRKEQTSKGLSIGGDKSLLKIAFLGSLIAAVLLTIVYLAFALLSAGFSKELISVGDHEILGALTYNLLGPYAGIFASIGVSFACLTTEIALTVVFADFLHQTILKEKFSYQTSLIATLVASFSVSTLQFEGIASFLFPILKICYPSLIALCVFNILYKLYGFEKTKSFFYGTLILTLIAGI